MNMNTDVIETAQKRIKKKIIRNTDKPIQKTVTGIPQVPKL